MSGKHYKGPEVSCCIKYFIFGFNVIFWVSGPAARRSVSSPAAASSSSCRAAAPGLGTAGDENRGTCNSGARARARPLGARRAVGV